MKNTSVYAVEPDFFQYSKMAEYIFSITQGLYSDSVPLINH